MEDLASQYEPMANNRNKERIRSLPRYKPCLWCNDSMYLHRDRYLCRDSMGCAYVEVAPAYAPALTLRWDVASRTASGVCYRVEARPADDPADWACSCPARRTCWHIRYGRELVACGVRPLADQPLRLAVPGFIHWLRARPRAKSEGRAA